MLQIFKIDPARDLVFVKGSVPGHKGNWVSIRDANRDNPEHILHKPFPTFFARGDDDEDHSGELLMPKGEVDPLTRILGK